MKNQHFCFVVVLFVLLAMVDAQAWTGDQIDFPGDSQGWSLALDSSKYTGPDGSSEWFRYSFSAGATDSDYNFKMVSGNDWAQDYGGNTSFPKNDVAILYYQPIGDTAANLVGGVSNGYTYVYTTKDPGLSDTFISVMELSGNPVGIASVSGGTGSYETNEAVAVSVHLDANPSTEENVYIRLSTDGFTTDSIIPVSMTGSNGTAVITNLLSATEYEWYVFTSTASSNVLASANDFSINALSLAWANNGGTNYSFGTPGEAGWMWHNNNRVQLGSSNVQCWVKIGYINGDVSSAWVTNAAIYYTTDGTTAPAGSYGVAGNAQTGVARMQFDHTEEDSSLLGESMWWVGTMTNLPQLTTIRYKIGAWMDGGTEQFADYNTSATNNATFSFSLGTPGAQSLSVNGQNADYTTTKFFLDEIDGETAEVVVYYTPGVPDLDKVEIFSNLDRRDYVDVDYTNALISADGIPDGIKPPNGNYITTNDTGAYFRAYPMTAAGGGVYVWTGIVSKCGAYRLTARYSTNGMAANTWSWYTDDGRRDHAVVASPDKVHAMTMYELNTLTVEATDSTESGRSTFVDLLGAADGDSDGFDPFNLDYLNFIQANCLWFQPIHPNGEERADVYTPGSPYATRDYFEVSHYMGSGSTEESAMAEFTNFVAKCDSYTGSVGTINIMLDGVFNHTSWDAEMGQGGVDLGFTGSKENRIGNVRPQWYANVSDYGQPATYYNSAYDNDIATAPDRGDFGKWDDVAELYFGKYSALVRHNPDNNGDYLNEDDVYDYAGMTTNQVDLWRYFAYYPEYWLEKTGHAGTNSFNEAQDDKGIDGLRCDFGQGLPPQCWEYIINRTRSIKWNFIFMAETLDGGKPGYRSNRHFDVLNENLVFQFTQAKINDSWDVKSALEDRRTGYNGGTILLNITSHDEVLPDNDTWLNASRYGALSAVDGIPMMFYGQEQGIQNYNSNPSYWYYDGFRTDHEENFGKFVPHFKQWNQLMVWSNPPPNNTGLAQWYGRVNWARHNSPALQSPNRYFLSTTDGDDNAAILAVAKYEQGYASPTNKDVVLAFANLLRHGEAHALAADTFNLQPAWDLLGLDTGKYYQVQNLASSDAFSDVWDDPKSGSELYSSGLYISLGAGTSGNITNDGELVQYLRITEADGPNQAPVLTVPGPHVLPVGYSTNFLITASDGDGQSVSLTNTAYPSGASATSGVDTLRFFWTAQPGDVGTTNLLVFVGDDLQDATNSVATNTTTITVPFDHDADALGDDWEWVNYGDYSQNASGDSDGDGQLNGEEYIAGTQPTNQNSLFAIDTVKNLSNGTNIEIRITTQPGRRYEIEFVDDVGGTPSWQTFANTNDGYGTWIETSAVTTTFGFVEDYGTNTSQSAPTEDFRVYRVNVRAP